MGAEALCRGASFALGIEQSSRACSVIRQNWQQVARPEQQFQVWRGDILQRLPGAGGQKFDCIYFDPPYASNLYQPVLEAIAHYQLLPPDGEVAVEHDPQGWAMREIPTLEACREKNYGNTALTFYCLASKADGLV